MVFDAVVVSCGTCREALHELGVEETFSCSLIDASAFALNQAGMPLVQQAGRLSYHTPCHDSLRGEGVTLLKRLIADVSRQPHCCSEAGTLSLSRPDITRAMHCFFRHVPHSGPQLLLRQRLGKLHLARVRRAPPSQR